MERTQTNLAWGALLDLSTARPGPLHAKLTSALRTAIRDGRLPRGAALPPSRTLAEDLKVSRTTVTRAYGQLTTEGYLTAHTGSSTRVSWTPEPVSGSPAASASPALATPPRQVRYDMSECTPDFRAFPRRAWLDAMRTAAETAPFHDLGYGEPGGVPLLRGVLAEHLNRRRGTAIRPDLLSIHSGSGQALVRLLATVAESGIRRIAVEDPGSIRFRRTAPAAGLTAVPIPVDDDGLIVEELDAHPEITVVCTGPAHNVATGCVMSPARRAALLAWARRVDGLIIEDDYDSEFTYDGPAQPALQGADPFRVALIGSMTRTMTPTVGVGWLAAPPRWAAAGHPDPLLPSGPFALNQMALANLLESGAYDRHLRASRQRFRARRNVLLAELARLLPECRVRGAQGGLHVLLDLPDGVAGDQVRAEAQRHDLRICQVGSTRFVHDPDDNRLLVGYANLNDSLVVEAVEVLAQAVRHIERSTARG